MEYVPLDYHDQVAEFLGNYRSARQIFEDICEINRELLRRRDEL